MLIVNCDFGMHDAIDVAVLDLDRSGHRQLVQPDGAVPAGTARPAPAAPRSRGRSTPAGACTDYEFPTSPETRELLRREGIVVIDYTAVRQAWS